MTILLCPECEVASVAWPALRWHFTASHKDTPVPSREEIETVEEVPEGYRLIGQRKSKVSVAPSRSMEIEHEPEPGHEFAPKPEPRPPTPRPALAGTVFPTELPDNFMERLKLSLEANGIPSDLREEVMTKVNWHSQVQANPEAFGRMLESIFGIAKDAASRARYMSKLSWIISEVFPPPAPSGAPPFFPGYNQPTTGTPWLGGGWQQQPAGGPWYGGYGQPQPAPQQDPIERLINYQIWKDQREAEMKEKGTPAESPEVAQVRAEQVKTREKMDEVLKQLAEAGKKDEQAKIEARFSKLESLIIEGVGKKGGEENPWLTTYLAERDKREGDRDTRYQDMIKELKDDVVEGRGQLAEASAAAARAKAEGKEEERISLEEHRKILEGQGYSPRPKEAEEQIVGFLTKDIGPGILLEARETGKALRDIIQERVSSGKVKLPGGGTVSPEEVGNISERLSEAMELEIRMRQHAGTP